MESKAGSCDSFSGTESSATSEDIDAAYDWTAEENGNDEDVEFVLRLSDHVDSTAFNERCKELLVENMHLVDLSTDEHPHEYYELYQEFQKIIEDMLEGFLVQEKLQSPSELYRKVKRAYDNDEFAHEYVNFILRAAEYESFVEALKNRWKSFAKENNVMPTGESERARVVESKHK